MSAEVTPYYSDDAVTIYHADCLDIIDRLTFDVVVTDPPYGIKCNTDYSRLRGTPGVRKTNGHPGGRRHPRVVGDAEPFDPSWMMGSAAALFGVNHYSTHIPEGWTWHVWDKRDGLGSNMLADAEMWATSWGSGPTRIFRYKWLGYMRPRGAETTFDHPTAKPVALMRHIIDDPRTPTGTILDPYAGSGTTLRAAKDLGRKAIGIEIEERYCEIAAKRMGQEVLAL